MGFNLEDLLQKVDGLDDLTSPFSKEEVDAVLKDLPTDRAPGPDGFNGLFVKKCWNIIEKDFMELINQFADGHLSLQGINGSLITLIPKMLNPEGPNDYRHISLTNTCVKFLTKL